MDWPHSPPHHFTSGGVYFITAGTYLKQHFFRTSAALDTLRRALFEQAAKHNCWLQAWALFPNHYHLVVECEDGERLRRMLVRLHIGSAIDINRSGQAKGRKVWFQFWDTLLTNEASWLARLRYTHENAVHHGIARTGLEYRGVRPGGLNGPRKRPSRRRCGG